MDKGVWALAIIRTAESIHRVSPCGTKQTKWPRSGSPSIPFSFYEPPIAVSLGPVSLPPCEASPFHLRGITVTGKRRVTRFSKVLSPLFLSLYSRPWKTPTCGISPLCTLHLGIVETIYREARYLHFTDREWSIGERSAIESAKEMLFLARLSPTIIRHTSV